MRLEADYPAAAAGCCVEEELIVAAAAAIEDIAVSHTEDRFVSGGSGSGQAGSRHDERFDPAAIGNLIIDAVSIDHVGAAAVGDLGPRIVDRVDIVAASAMEMIRADAADKDVVACAADQRVAVGG